MKVQELRSLKRGLKVLALINQHGVASISELARRLDLPRTTAERIVTTLATEGYLTRFEDDKRYGLSLKIFSLAQGMSNETWLTNVADDYLQAFTHKHGWPMAIVTPQGSMMIIRSTTYPSTSLWLTQRRLGSEESMAASSGGLTYLAYAASGERRHLLDIIRLDSIEEMRILNQGRGIDYVLERIAADGYTFEPQATEKEDSVAVPILLDGVVKGSLMMMYMTRALRRADVITQFVPALQAIAAQIAKDIDRQQSNAPSDRHRPLPTVLQIPAAVSLKVDVTA